MDDLYTELEKTKNEKEPAWRIGISTAIISFIITIVTYFAPIEPRTQTLIFTVGFIVVPFILSYLIRYKVWSPHSVNEILEDISAVRPTLEEIQKNQKSNSISRDFFGGDPYEAADVPVSAFDVKKEESYNPPVKKRPESLDDYGKPMPDIQHDPEDGPF